MNNKSNKIEPIPNEFASYEEAAEFWDNHDTTDYLEYFETVAVETEFRGRHYEVEIDEDIIQILDKEAVNRDVTVSSLINDMLREKLRPLR